MQFYFYDHMDEGKRFEPLHELANSGVLGLEEATDGISDAKLKHGDFVVFVHSSKESPNTKDEWMSFVNNGEEERKRWIIYVSSHLEILADCNTTRTRGITRSLGDTIQRLHRDKSLRDRFKESCECNQGPEIPLLVLEGLGWPEKVLARYLLVVADVDIEEKKLSEMGLDDAAVTREFNEHAGDLGLKEMCDFDAGELKQLVVRVREAR